MIRIIMRMDGREGGGVYSEVVASIDQIFI